MLDEDKKRLGLGPLEDYTVGAEPIVPGQGVVSPPEPEVDTSFSEALAPSRELYGTMNWITRWERQRAIRPDPSYRLDSNYDELVQDVPEHLVPALNDNLAAAKSSEEAWSIRNQYMQETAWQDEISKQGWKGAAATLTVGLFDEGNLVLGTLGPVVALGRVKAITNGVRKSLRVGAYAAVGAAENAAFEALGVAASQTRHPVDIAYAAAFGGLFGAGAGAFIAPRLRTADRPDLGIDTSEPDIGAVHERHLKEADEITERNLQGDDAIDPQRTVETDIHIEDSIRQARGQDLLDEVPDEPIVRPIADVTTAKRAQAAAKLDAEEAKLNVQLQKIADDEILEPVRPTLLDELDNVKRVIADLKDPATLNKVERTRQDQGLQKAKRHFMTTLQKEDPDTFAELGLGRNPSTEDFKLLVSKGADKMAARVEKVYKKDKAEYDAALTKADESQQQILDRLSAIEAQRRTEAQPEAPSGSVGAAAAEVQPREVSNLTTAEYDEFVENGPPESRFRSARQLTSTYAKLTNDVNAGIRWLGSKLLTDHAGTVDGGVSHNGASTVFEEFKASVLAPFVRDHKNAYRAWMKAQGRQTVFSNNEALREFDMLVGDAIEGVGRGLDDENVMKAANATRKVFKKAKDWAEESGLEGFDEFATRDDYFPHIHNSYAAGKIRSEHRLMDDIPERMRNWSIDEELIYQGLRRANHELDPETAALIARNYMDIVQLKDAGLRGAHFDMSRIGEENYLRTQMEAIGIDGTKIDEFVDLTERLRKPSDSERVKYAKTRTVLDMNTTIKAKRVRADGGYDLVELPITSLFHREAGKLAHSYIRSVGGRAAIAEATKGTPFHVTSDKAWNDMIGKVREWEVSEQLQPQRGQLNDFEDTMQTLEMVRNTMIGIPVNENQAHNNITRQLLRYNFIGRMGQMAWAQASELGNIMARVGMTRMSKQIPEVAAYFKRDADGILEHPLARLGEDEMGFGAEAAMGRHFADHVTDVEAYDGDIPGWKRVWENTMHTSERIIGYPMRKVMATQQRMLNIGVWQELGDIAKGKRGVYSAEQLQRWGDYGLSPEDMENVIRNLDKHGEFDASGRLVYPHPDKWGDPTLWANFKHGMFRLTRRVVQENDISNLPSVMPKNWAKLAFQFRTFQLGAIDKQLLNNVNALMRSKGRDFEAWQTLSYQTLFAGAAYYGMVQTKSLLMDDKAAKEYKDKLLSPERLGAAAFARSGWSTLIPGIVDTAVWMTDADPIFGLTRGSGLRQNFVSGNPSVDLVFNKLPAAAKGVIAPIVNEDYQLSKRDMRAWQGALPLGTLPGVYNMWNAAPDLFDLPDTSKGD